MDFQPFVESGLLLVILRAIADFLRDRRRGQGEIITLLVVINLIPPESAPDAAPEISPEPEQEDGSDGSDH